MIRLCHWSESGAACCDWSRSVSPGDINAGHTRRRQERGVAKHWTWLDCSPASSSSLWLLWLGTGLVSSDSPDHTFIMRLCLIPAHSSSSPDSRVFPGSSTSLSALMMSRHWCRSAVTMVQHFLGLHCLMTSVRWENYFHILGTNHVLVSRQIPASSVNTKWLVSTMSRLGHIPSWCIRARLFTSWKFFQCFKCSELQQMFSNKQLDKL